MPSMSQNTKSDQADRTFAALMIMAVRYIDAFMV
jgi:hypothetical protein